MKRKIFYCIIIVCVFVINSGVTKELCNFNKINNDSNNNLTMFNGDNAAVGSASFFASIAPYDDSQVEGKQYTGLGGTLIAPNWILSCSHGNHEQINNGKYFANFNLYDLNNAFASDNTKWNINTNHIRIDKVILQPNDLNGLPGPYDFSLLHLETSAPSNCSFAYLSNQKPVLNECLQAYGFGMDRVDSNGNLLYPTNMKTEKQYVDEDNDYAKYNQWTTLMYDKNVNFIAGNKQSEIDNPPNNSLATFDFHGDSGSGLFYNIQNKNVLVGVCSACLLKYSDFTNVPKKPIGDVFGNVSSVNNWIINTVENTFPSEHEKVNIYNF